MGRLRPRGEASTRDLEKVGGGGQSYLRCVQRVSGVSPGRGRRPGRSRKSEVRGPKAEIGDWKDNEGLRDLKDQWAAGPGRAPWGYSKERLERASSWFCHALDWQMV